MLLYHLSRTTRLAFYTLLLTVVICSFEPARSFAQEPDDQPPTAPLYKIYLPLVLTTAQHQPGDDNEQRRYIVYDVTNKFQRTEISQTGADLHGGDINDDSIVVLATPSVAAAIKALGYKIEPLPPELIPLAFPAEDAGYHDYDEMVTVINQAATDHANITQFFSIGQSYEGRELWAAKISDNPTVDEPETEVLFTFHLHAREHLTVEQGLYLLDLLTDEYTTDPRISGIVNALEIYMIFDVNPDGGEFDHATGEYVSWRKNRQPNAGSSSIGTDLNRNWSYQWGCCGGSSGSPSADTYRGSAPFSAPETDAIRNFVESRVINGEQQIKAHIDTHTKGELIIYPYGYTYEPIPADMTVDDHNVFVTLGGNMADLNHYSLIQSSLLYIVDGTIKDWMYGQHKIFSFLYELYPLSSTQGGFYPGDEIIAEQTARNREALLYFLDTARCPYQVIGLESQYCDETSGDPEPLISLSNLQGYWDLDELTGQRADRSGGNNHLSETNSVAAITGQQQLAAHFEDANNEYLSINDTVQNGLDISGSLTLVGWMRPESFSSINVLANKYEYNVTNRAYRFFINGDNRIGLTVSPDGTYQDSYKLQTTLATPFTPNSWYHVAGVFDSAQQTLSLYLDGALIDSRSVSYSGIYNASAPFMLGASLNNGQVTQFFDGELDEWYVFDKALSASEITELKDLSSESIDGLTINNNSPTPLGSSTTLSATVSAGSNIIYTWDFGDGTTGSGPVVNYIYPAPGVFTAVVTGSNLTSVDSATATVTILDVFPAAAFTSSSPDDLGQSTSFTNTSSGTNLTFVWDFGDGSTLLTTPNPTHTYPAIGDYTVTLTVSNGVGSDVFTDTVTIEPPPNPITGLTLENDGPTPVGSATTLTVTIQSGDEITYLWDFGDGSALTGGGPTVSHTYTQTGSYPAMVFASNTVSTESATTTISILEAPPLAGFTSSSPDELGQVTNFTNTSTGGNLSFSWNFGDGSAPVTTPNPIHTYATTGTFAVSLTATNSAGSNTTTTSVTIVDPPPVPSPLVGSWSLDEVSGQRQDSSGNANHLSDNGVGSGPGRVGMAADLEASEGDYLTIDDASHTGLDLAGSLTLAGWIQPETIGSWHILASKYSFSGINDRAYRLDLRPNNQLGFIVSPDGVFSSNYILVATLTTPLTSGTWYHLAGVFDADQQTLTLYLDGVPIASRSVTYNTVYNASAPFMLGANIQNGAPDQFFDGLLDEWRVYDKALSQAEIDALIAWPEPITGLSVSNDGPTPLGDSTTLSAAVTGGTEITYDWDLSDGTLINDGGPTINHSYSAIGTYVATVTASNSLSNLSATTSVTIVDPLPPPPPLVGYWALDEVSGQRQDSSGNENHLSDNGVGSGPGRVGTAADLEASEGDYLTIDDASHTGLDVAGSLTLAGWIKPESSGGWHILAAKYSFGGVNERAYRLDLRPNNQVGFMVSPDGVFSSDYLLLATLGAPLNNGSWYHMAAVFDAAQQSLTLYLDGVAIASRSVTYNSIYNASAPFMLGANIRNGIPDQFFDGQLDEWRVYTKALTAAEIAALIALPEPITGLSVSNDGPTVVGGSTTLSAGVTGGTEISYDWDLGDGTLITDGGPTINHSYSAIGSYEATVTAYNSVSNQNATTSVVVVATDTPITGLSVSNDSPTVIGGSTTLSAGVTGGTAISYDWDLGDGTLITDGGPTINHSYGVTGSYEATVTAYNSLSNLSATTSVTIVDPPPVPSPLVGSWSLDEVSGQRQDSSGNENHLSDNGVGSGPGRVGTAADLEASEGDYLTIDDASHTGLDLAGSLTLAGWIQPETIGSWHILASKYSFSGINDRAYRLDLRPNNQLGFIVSPDGVFSSNYILVATLTTPLTSGTWYHLAGVFDADQQTLTLYLDGVPIASRSVTYNTVYNASAPFMLGANIQNGAPDQFFDGLLDEWRVYDKALSQAEIDALIAWPEPITGLSVSNDGPTPLGDSTTLSAAVTGGTEITYDWDLSDGTLINDGGPTINHSYSAIGTYVATVTASNSLSNLSATTSVTIVDPLPPPPPLVGYWALDEVSGQRQDSSGNENHLSDNGVGSGPGRVGTAADLEASEGDYLTIDDASHTGLDVAGSLTLAGWIKPESSGGWHILAAKYSFGGVNERAYRLDLRPNNQVGFMVSPDGVFSSDYLLLATLGAPLNNGSWYHMAAVFDAAQQSLTLYLDGVAIASRSVTYNSIYNASAPFMLGANIRNGIPDQFFDGQLDEWRVYTKALTAAEIAALIALPEPITGLSVSNDGPTVVGGSTTLSAGVTGGTEISYDWDLGDGTLITDGGPTINHSYSAIGSYEATVTAYNSVSNQNATTSVSVEAMPAPISGLTLTNDGPTVLGDNTTLSASVSSGSAITYDWDLGGGLLIFDAGPTLIHSYSLTGTFVATVTAFNIVNSQSATTTVTIETPMPDPITGLTASNDGPTTVGNSTALSASVTSGTDINYTWDLGDGNMGSGPIVNHTYSTVGNYLATVTATNFLGSIAAQTTVMVQAASNNTGEFLGGYASKLSVAQGESLDFHISTNVSSYNLEIYREGSPRQLMTTINSLSGAEYDCQDGYTTGCGWPVAHTFQVPTNWPLRRLHRRDSNLRCYPIYPLLDSRR